MLQLRDYQRTAVDASVRFLRSEGRENGIIVLPTGAGKSLVIAAIAYALDSPVLIFQPSKEILVQNVEKLRSLGVTEIGVFSASCKSRTMSKFTFATIGSVRKCAGYFRNFRYILIDECHGVNPEAGMYHDFLFAIRGKVLGLTATPYRMFSDRYTGLMLRFITRMKPTLFQRLVCYVQVGELSRRGYLAPLEYFDVPTLDLRSLKINTTQRDYDETSLRDHYNKINFAEKIEEQINGLLLSGRQSILVFTRFTQEAEYVARKVGKGAAVVSGSTPKVYRDVILQRFKAGELRVVLNVGVLTTGFDFPALTTILLARPTMSLGLYYQMVGRALRPFNGERKWVVDMCGNFVRFGRVEDLEIKTDPDGRRPAVYSRGEQLTNIYYKR